MDTHDPKLDQVLDIIEHPEQYSSERLEEIMADTETRSLYTLLCKTSSALKADHAQEADTAAEWEALSRRYPQHPWKRFLPGNRVATIAMAFIITSLAAVAVGIAISMSVTVKHTEPTPTVNALTTTTSSESPTAPTDTATCPDINTPSVEALIFENAPLDSIVEVIGRIHGVRTRVNNKEAARLRLYYKLEPSLTIPEIVDQLNTFEQIDIRFQNNTITVN